MNLEVLGTRLFHFRGEALRGLERRNVVFGNRNGRIFRNVAGYLLGAFLHDETAETAQVDVVVLDERILHALHERLDDGLHLHLLDTGAFSDFADDICLSHIFMLLKLSSFRDCKYTLNLYIRQ